MSEVLGVHTTQDEPRGVVAVTDERARDLFPSLADAIRNGRATFDHLFEAYYGKKPRFTPQPEERAAALMLYPTVRELFEKINGEIDQEYWCDRLKAGAVFTSRHEVHVINDWEQDDARIVEILNECDHIEMEVHRLRRDEDRHRCLELIYDLYTLGLDAEDNRRAHPDQDNAVELGLVRAQLEYVRGYYLHAAQRIAQVRYFRGLLAGTGVLVGALIVALVALSLLGIDAAGALPLGPLVASVAAGGVGAVVSVLTRATFGGLKLDPQADLAELERAGAFRPAVGALFGFAFQVLTNGGLLPLAVPKDPTTQANFFLGLAFLAGFSERWAQDVLARPPKGLA